LSKLENPITSYFVICHGSSTTHIEAIADNVEKQIIENFSMKVKHVEGRKNAQWILIDLFGVIVHVFLEDTRHYYNLEQLWADGKITHIKEEIN
jgi:ribosome-associated protein